MVYYFDPVERWRQEEAARKSGFIEKTGALSEPLPEAPTSSSTSQPKPPTWQDKVKDKAIQEGLKAGGGYVGGQLAGGEPSVTGTDDLGNTTFSDGAVVKSDGTVLTEGSYATGVKRATGTVAGAYQIYKALQAKSDKDKALGTASGLNTIGTANGLYGAGTGSAIGAGIGAASILSSDAPDKVKAKGLRRTTEDAMANYWTGGGWGIAQQADRALLGGKTDKLRTGIENTPVLGAPAKIGDKVTTKALGLIGTGKSEDQQKRDKVRKALNQAGFFGEAGSDDWTLDNEDGSGFDVGKDGGARLDDGRKYYDVADPTFKDPVQSQAIGAVNPLAYIITGGDEKLATEFAGYFTNTVMQGDGAKDVRLANANALDKYKKAGYDTPDKAHMAIEELVKAGKLDPEKAAAFHGGIDTVFGILKQQSAPRSGGGGGESDGGGSSDKKDKKKKKRRQGAKRTYESQTYTPHTYSATTTAPLGTRSEGGTSFANALANVYHRNQGE